MEILGYRISYLKLCWRHINDIYGKSQFNGTISADKGIDRFISRWVVDLDDEILSITVLGEDFFVTKSSVNLVSPIT